MVQTRDKSEKKSFWSLLIQNKLDKLDKNPEVTCWPRKKLLLFMKYWLFKRDLYNNSCWWFRTPTPNQRLDVPSNPVNSGRSDKLTTFTSFSVSEWVYRNSGCHQQYHHPHLTGSTGILPPISCDASKLTTSEAWSLGEKFRDIPKPMGFEKISPRDSSGDVSENSMYMFFLTLFAHITYILVIIIN